MKNKALYEILNQHKKFLGIKRTSETVITLGTCKNEALT